MYRNNILKYIQRDAMLHSLFYLETTTHHQEHKQLYPQHLVFVTPLLLPVAIAPETCRAISRYNKLCNVASCWIYIRISE
jgi:hypothetical protein